MKRIQQLDPFLSNQIAAGEVIERPASVIKELVENSLDAGSTQIEIDVTGGGIHHLSVRDNGHGIEKEDLSLALARHATSKLYTLQDLMKITSLGFRGEALASIASVSRCRLLSCVSGKQAWQIQYVDGREQIMPVAHPIGTTVEVQELFYNVPVRRKFLKSPKTEFHAIEEVVKRLALSHPEVGFRLRNHQRQVRFYPGVGDRLEYRIQKVLGRSFYEHAVFTSAEKEGLSLKAWIARDHLLRSSERCYVFVNQRMVKDRLLMHAIREVYHEAIGEQALKPHFVLYLTVDPEAIDVNVHPTKQEVRFSQPRLVHDFVTYCVRGALGKEERERHTFEPESTACSRAQESIAERPYPSSDLLERKLPYTILDHTKVAFGKEEERKIFSSESVIRSREREVVAEVTCSSELLTRTASYAILEESEGLRIISLEAIKGDLLKSYFEEKASAERKHLLFPLRLEKKEAFQVIASHMSQCLALGFTFSIEGEVLFLLAVPALLADKVEAALEALLQACESRKEESVFVESFCKALPVTCLRFMPETLFHAFLEREKARFPLLAYTQLEALETVPS